MYYLFTEQVKYMHKFPPNYNDSGQKKKSGPQKNRFHIPRQDHKKAIKDTVDQIYMKCHNPTQEQPQLDS